MYGMTMNLDVLALDNANLIAKVNRERSVQPN